MQDSALLQRMKKVLSRRVLRMLSDLAKRDLPKPVCGVFFRLDDMARHL